MLGFVTFCRFFVCEKKPGGACGNVNFSSFLQICHIKISRRNFIIMETNFRPIVIDTWFFHSIARMVGLLPFCKDLFSVR
jgi:hypothetical protein